MPRSATRTALLMMVVPALASAATLFGQTAPSPSAADALARARSLYYTPVNQGLRSLHCEVHFAWKDFMQKAANQQIPDTDPRLKYLQSVALSVDDDLQGSGELHWQAPAPPPDGTEDSVGKIRDGMRQMWAGFFQSWNSFMTGDLITVDPQSKVERTASGFHVATRESGGLAEEQFDPNLVLTSVHISTSTLESTIHPTFAPGPQGLLVTAIRSSYQQPPSAPPTEVTMGLRYSAVNNFQLPSELNVAVGPAQFSFQLVNCTVQTQITQPAAH